jgi:hypothetical protein
LLLLLVLLVLLVLLLLLLLSLSPSLLSSLHASKAPPPFLRAPHPTSRPLAPSLTVAGVRAAGEYSPQLLLTCCCCCCPFLLRSFPSSGEYEEVVGDEGDDECSLLAPAGTAWGPEEGLDLGPDGAGGSVGWAAGGGGGTRPLSAGGGRTAPEGAGGGRDGGGGGRGRQSRKTARPRTAGRERMKEGDREDLLVLSSDTDPDGPAVRLRPQQRVRPGRPRGEAWC